MTKTRILKKAQKPARYPKALAQAMIKKAAAKVRRTTVTGQAEPMPAPAADEARKKTTKATTVYIIKKISRNKTAFFIDTLENLTVRLAHFILAAPEAKTTGRGRKKQTTEAPKLKRFKTPEALVAALNETCLRTGSEDIRYELAQPAN